MLANFKDILLSGFEGLVDSHFPLTCTIACHVIQHNVVNILSQYELIWNISSCEITWPTDNVTSNNMFDR